MSRSLLDVALESLAFLTCSTAHQDMNAKGVLPQAKLSPMAFDGFEPVVEGDFNEGDFILFQEDATDVPVWPVDCAWAHPTRPGLGWPEGSWAFTRARTLDPARWRGRLAITMPRMIEAQFAVASPSGWSVTAATALGMTKKGFVECRRNIIGGHTIQAHGYGMSPAAYGGSFQAFGLSEEWEHLQFIGGFALRRRYHWSVLLGEGDGPRARFITDLTGVRETFRLRDIEAGRARRAALRHWVREHWRRSRSPSKSDRTWVREHLRGATKFSWNGLQCEISAPIIGLPEG